jgi:hypothetical protein
MKTYILSLLLTLCAVLQSVGQCLPAPAASCDDEIPFICNLEGYCGQTPDVNVVTDVFDCGATSLDIYGMQVIEFLATGTVLSLTINYTNCNGANQGGGVEYGMSALLLEKCDEDDEALDCATAFTQSGSMTVSINAEAGEAYFLLLTGWLGNMCSYDITVNSGADSIPSMMLTGDPWQGPTAVCGFETATYIAPEVLHAEEYIWTLPGNVILETEVNTLDIVFDQNTPEGVFEICVSAENACGLLNDYACLDVIVNDTIVLDVEMTLCAGDTLSAFGQAYEAPGSYTYQSTGANGCDTVATIELSAFELPVVDATITPDDGSGSGTVTLTVTGGAPPYSYMYSWPNVGGGLAAGDYSMTVTDANGCQVIFDFTIPLETSTSNHDRTTRISISPNPVAIHQPFYLQTDNSPSIRAIEIVNMNGQVIWRSTAITQTNGLVILPGMGTPGLYQVKTLSDNAVMAVGRVVVY